MLDRHGFTLMEIIVVLIIIAVCAAFAVPNFNTPTEQANAVNAQNNLMAIYGAEQNYRINNGNFYISPAASNDLAKIDSSLVLSIQDDGTYSYYCQTVATSNFCYAARTNSAFIISIQLDAPIVKGVNPLCPAGNSWCP